MKTSFRQKCGSALTHPLTIGALLTLLLNDLALKSLWPDHWVTGKLSDLAWVVFSPPLLAFLLSYLCRRNPLAERGTFAASYVGAPPSICGIQHLRAGPRLDFAVFAALH